MPPSASSTKPESTEGSPTTLLFHDGELGDVQDLLRRLGAPFTERRGALLPEDRGGAFGLVIATPQRMLSLHVDASQARPTQIAICDSDSRSLRNSLRRAGIQLMVRRPVHPAALRAIVLHSLYRGPERRRSVRVSIGAPVRIRRGWRQQPAVLADLSVGGFRVLTARRVEPGRSVRLMIPAEVSGSRAFSLKARVLRALPGEDGSHTLTAQFQPLRPRQIEAVKAVLKAHASGPARFDPEELPELSSEADPAAPAKPPASTPRSEGTQGCSNVRSPGTTPRPTPPAAPLVANGRCAAAPRHAAERRAMALGDEATRVLMGRDISLGGMLVDPNPLLRVGENVRLAIHVTGQEMPLVLTARVHRDDGERGVVLRFHELDPKVSRQLDTVLDSLPVFEPGGPPAAAGMIVSEILPSTEFEAPRP